MSEEGPRKVFDGLRVTVEVRVGTRHMTLEEVLQLKPGSVMALERPAGEMLDVLVGGVQVASAEVVVLNERLSVRISEIEDEKAG